MTAPALNLVADSAKTWLDQTHPDYSKNANHWQYALDHYTGEILFEEKIGRYLIRREPGEADESYKQRQRLADYTNHFGALVDSLAGMLFSNEQEAIRKTEDEDGRGLGDLEDPESPIARLWEDADGRGMGWLTLWKKLASKIIVTPLHWVLVDAPNKTPRVRTLLPFAVPNWFEQDGRVVAALLKEQVDPRASIMDATAGSKKVERYILYTLDGWQRFEKKENVAVGLTGERNTGRYTFVDANGDKMLPIYPVVLPIERQVGWTLAKKANAIFNLESARDWLLWTGNFHKLLLVAKDTFFKKLTDALAQGVNALQDDPEYAKSHQYIAPDTTNAAAASAVLKEKVEAFYITGFREYGDSARERTATEVRQDVSSGVGAFLQLLKAAIDDAENQALRRVEQILYERESKNWNIAYVERSNDFLPVDVGAMIERIRTRYFGKDSVVPVPRDGKLQALRRVAAWDGLKVDDAELEQALRLHEVTTNAATGDGLPLPAEARAQMAVAFMEALGYIKTEDAPETDGQMTRDEALAAARAIAEAEDAGRAQMGNVGNLTAALSAPVGAMPADDTV